MDKYNYVAIVWEQEVENKTVSVRNVRTKEQFTLSLDEFISKLSEEIKSKSL